jgi:hypothetical protein
VTPFCIRQFICDSTLCSKTGLLAEKPALIEVSALNESEKMW